MQETDVKYFVISFSEDGDVNVDCMSKETIEKRLNDDYWEEKPNLLTERSNFGYESGILIIGGRLCTPKSVKTVKEWKVGN